MMGLPARQGQLQVGESPALIAASAVPRHFRWPSMPRLRQIGRKQMGPFGCCARDVEVFQCGV
eukprot:1975060-Amphidinium_carterae.1